MSTNRVRFSVGGMPAYTFPVNRYLNSNISEKSDYVRNYSRNDDNNTINAYTTYHLALGGTTVTTSSSCSV